MDNPLNRKPIRFGGIFALFAFLASYLPPGGRARGVVGFALAVISPLFIFGLGLIVTGYSLLTSPSGKD